MAINFERSGLGLQNNPNENRAKKYSVGTFYTPVQDGRFLVTTRNADRKAVKAIALPLNRVNDRTFHGML